MQTLPAPTPTPAASRPSPNSMLETSGRVSNSRFLNTRSLAKIISAVPQQIDEGGAVFCIRTCISGVLSFHRAKRSEISLSVYAQEVTRVLLLSCFVFGARFLPPQSRWTYWGEARHSRVKIYDRKKVGKEAIILKTEWSHRFSFHSKVH